MTSLCDLRLHAAAAADKGRKQENSQEVDLFFFHIRYNYIYATGLPLECRMAGNG